MKLHNVLVVGHKVNGERELCSECFRFFTSKLGFILVPFGCLICETKPTNDRRQVCRECLDKITEKHKIDMHTPVDLV